MSKQPKQTPILPIGAKTIAPLTKKLGNYSPQVFDAVVERNGVTWYRIQGGFGSRGDREDWIADIPEFGPSVSDYNWNSGSFGGKFASFEDACDQKLSQALQFARQVVAKEEKALARRKAALSFFATTIKS